MGIKTYIVELIMGDQAADKRPLAAPGALRGQLIEETVPAPLELLQALAEVGGMHRDWIHSQSANGTLPYKITSIVTYVPEVHLNRVALGRQSIHVRVKNAISVLEPVFARHPHIDCSALTDWVIQKKQPLAPVADDGFEDARIASPNSPLNAEFAFKGHFLSEEEVDRRQRNPGPGVHARNIDKEASMTTLTYRLLDDAGTEIQAGVLSAFPATIGRDNSSIAVPKSQKLVSGPHIELSTDPAGNVFVTDVGSNNKGSTNGTWLENGAQVKQLIKATRLPASGRLILGADKPIPRAAVLEFSIKSPHLEKARRGPGGHDPTIPAEVLSEGHPDVSGGVPPSRVAETKIATLNQGGKFGTLALKYSNGDVQTVPINTLPFTIGRDPELKVGEGAAVRAACEKVSGRHVRIEDTGSDGFHVRNLALNRNGSFLDSIITTEGFFWSFSKPTASRGRLAQVGWGHVGRRNRLGARLSGAYEVKGSQPAAWGVRCGAWLVASASTTGEHHDVCEDASMAHFTGSGGIHLCVADGVSLGDVGHVAAQALVRHCISLPEGDAQSRQAVGSWVEAADAVVAKAVSASGHTRGAACMASAWLGACGSGSFSHVGDCRLYQWGFSPDGTVDVADLTVDQTYLHLGEVPPQGVAPRNPARMAGSGSVGEPEVHAHRIAENSGLLLCSDGVHSVLTAQDLAALIAAEIHSDGPAGRSALERVSQSIVLESVQRRSADDICVAIVWRQAVHQLRRTDHHE